MKYIATDEPIKDGYPNITHDSWSPSEWWREVNPNVIKVVNDDGSVERKRLCMNLYGHYYLSPVDCLEGSTYIPKKLYHFFTGDPWGYDESNESQDEKDWRDLYALADIGSHMYWFRKIVLMGMPRYRLREITNYMKESDIARAESWKATRKWYAWSRLDEEYGDWMGTRSTDILPSDERLKETARIAGCLS